MRLVSRFLAVLSLTLAFQSAASAQRAADFKEAQDSLKTLLQEKTTVSSSVKLTKVIRNGHNLDLYFDKYLSDYPWNPSTVQWFRGKVEELFPDSWKDFSLGSIFWKGMNLNQLITPELTSDGKPARYSYVYDDPRTDGRFIRRVGEQKYPKGLSDRYLAVWQSHGRYYVEKLGRWTWQRAPLFRTVEDMYTQSYVLPFLIPMLENAGAYVITPRERDTNRREVIADNDRSFSGPRDSLTRASGKYSEKGGWQEGGTGFSDLKKVYVLDDNPFNSGTVRKVATVDSPKATATAKWSFKMPERGNYAVYVSYRSIPGSSTCAHYTVNHLGGKTEFIVDQNRGGGTWTYIGSFDFDSEKEYSVVLDNSTPAGCSFEKNSSVTADAVRIGGGMGKIARGKAEERLADYRTSGVPSYMEGAMYWEQWAGVDSEIWQEHDTDYVNDYASRGAWTEMMKKDKGIPVDMSLAFHTDAGVTPNDSIVGTLSIYTLLCDGKRKTEDGIDRMTARHLCDVVQSQVCNDIREKWNPDWSRRQIWDKSYSECRTTSVPGMILELLSHQNFADMKFGLDPSFRFDVSRAVYKGALKFLSDLYGCAYQVQPLPVHAFSVELAGAKARLSWKPTEDPLEKTATTKGYILYTRTDSGAFDEGRLISGTGADVELKPGHLYSFKVAAYNDGGRSFPSETLSAAIAGESKGTVLIVNNFTRVSAPVWFDTPEHAGFLGSEDCGVPYIKDLSYIGESYNYNRDEEWESDEKPGFGATGNEGAGLQIAGNSFDYPSIHGKALLDLGYSFCSMSLEAYESYSPMGAETAVDIICGKQVSTIEGEGHNGTRFQVFPEGLRNAIKNSAAAGSDIIISGAYIATDLWSSIYPLQVDSLGNRIPGSPMRQVADTSYQAAGREFARDVLGFRLSSQYGGQAATTSYVHPVRNARRRFDFRKPVGYWAGINDESYCAEHCNAIESTDNHGATVLRYSGSEESAGVFHNKDSYRVAAFGFPLETVRDKKEIEGILRNTFAYFDSFKGQ